MNGQDYRDRKKPGEGAEAVTGGLCGGFHRNSFLDTGAGLGCGRKSLVCIKVQTGLTGNERAECPDVTSFGVTMYKGVQRARATHSTVSVLRHFILSTVL